MKKPRFDLLDMQLVNASDKDNNDDNHYKFGDTTYRHDGLTIGRDYLRFEGSTLTRGTLDPAVLTFEETIGRGAFSKVQRAIWKSQAAPCCEVAIKQYSILCDSSSQQRRQMLIQELRSLCQMKSPCLITLHGAFLEVDTVTVVLEYMDKGSLDTILNKNNNHPFSQSMVAAIAFQLLQGLEHLHNQRILHRDVKSENALMHSKNGAVKLCDFGLASIMRGGDASSLHKTVVGTTKFMAPERLRAQPYGRSSDIWSLGLLLRHISIGEKPWKDITSIVDLLVTVEDTPVSELVPEHLEQGLREILTHCLQHKPAKRMPAKLLLKSPWFSSVHGISSVSDARTAVMKEQEGTKRGVKRKQERSR